VTANPLLVQAILDNIGALNTWKAIRSMLEQAAEEQ
jgi:hypothetical protein